MKKGSPLAPGRRPVIAFSLLATFLVALMATVLLWGVLGTTGQAAGPEYYVARFAGLLPFGYAFAAGMVASVNPCGFLMLPTLIGYYLGREGQEADPVGPTAQHLLRGILLGLMMTLGFIALFAAIGGIIASGGQVIVKAFPWLGFSLGVVLALLGLWLLATGRSLGLTVASRAAPPSGRGPGSMFAYGVTYGICSLSCTLPVFLVVVGTSLATRGLLASLAQFVSYGLGMGLIVTAVALSTVTLKGALGRALRGMAPQVHRLSAIFLLGAGVYLLIYWVVLGEVFR